MAIARGAGTEIIRSAHFEDVDNSAETIIFGVQHHIYTVLSIIIKAQTIQAAGNYCAIQLIGYDATAGTSAQTIQIAQQNMQSLETFVWDNKFSFNGHEPTDFAGPMDSIVKQDAIADQGSSVAQKLQVNTAHVDDAFEVHVTYIDQNNA